MLYNSFLKDYANQYDTFYVDKDYVKECRYLKQIFKTADIKVKKVLDIACGTGNHCINLNKLGYQMYGQDISDDMLAVAKSKSKKLPIIYFKSTPMQYFMHSECFDAVICMFSSIGYLINHIDLLNTLDNVYASLKHGGVFVFDFWNKSCVEKNYSKIRVLKNRSSVTNLNRQNDVALIHYVFDNHHENHAMKYFEPSFIKSFLKIKHFKDIEMFPFMKRGKRIGINDWNIQVIAKK